MFWLATAIFVGVAVLLVWGLWRGGRGSGGAARPAVNEHLLIVGGGIVLPLLVLPVLWVLTLRSMQAQAAPPSPPRYTVEVVGQQWGYEVRYPAQGVALTNAMRLPAGEPVYLQVTSKDVIHSFWVPRLMGKIDMIPGKVYREWVVAAEPGRYLVECAEFCGLWHARMRMYIDAEPPEQFAAWLASQQ
jgi:cytochrome c oxidase subunit 2